MPASQPVPTPDSDTPSSPSVPSTATRKSRPLRRKTSHSVIERRRREKINEGLITLQHSVPACRDELRALLLSKAQSNKRNARRAPCEVEAEVEEVLREKVDTQMVLEKLCIISHTVDYVEELQQRLAAYERLCRCSPPVEAVVMATRGVNHTKLHAAVEEGPATSASSSRSSPASDAETQSTRKRHASFSDAIPTAEDVQPVAHCTACIVGRAKRQRHWGSNNPLELSKAHHSARKASTSSTEALQGVKSAVAGAPPTLPTLAQDDDHDDSSDSELALDDWHQTPHRRMPHVHDHYRCSRHQALDPDPLHLRLLRLGPKQHDKRHAVAHPSYLPSARPDLLYTSEHPSS